MGLKKGTKRIDEYDFDTVLPFGRCKGSTIGEVIDDGECSLIMYYINEGIITPSNDLYDNMRFTCAGGCMTCKYIF